MTLRLPTCCLALAMLAFTPLQAQTLTSFDLNPGLEDSSPGAFQAVGDAVLFFARTAEHGAELWRTDGTGAGTVMVKDISPGPTDGIRIGMVVVTHADSEVLGDVLYFGANDGVHGTELWRSDGTEAGTWMVQDLRAGPNNSSIEDLTIFDGALYFQGRDEASGFELWRTDGTEAGTVRVADIAPGAGSGAPTDLTVFDGALYFRADIDASGAELWRSDGTAAGTALVRDIRPGSGNSFPQNLTVVGSTLFFVANDGSSGRELWKTDGTTAGTTRVRDIDPGTGVGPRSRSLIAFGGALYFAADDGVSGSELWRSDGTEAGTVLVADINPGAASSVPRTPVVYDGALYVVAGDAEAGAEVWRSDGTEAGTVRVADINPGPASAFSGDSENYSGFIAFRGALYFNARAEATGSELWRTDGTEAGTVLVGDLRPGPAGSTPVGLATVDDALYFRAGDGTSGRELWRFGNAPVAADGGPETSGLTLTVAPNPARRTAALTLTLGDAGRVAVAVFDVLGRRVARLHDGPLSAGAHAFRLDAAALPPGIYITRVAAGDAVVTRRITVVR